MTSPTEENSTYFGFRKVSPEEKLNLVTDVFRKVAPKYDLMNDLMSFGLHRLWKRYMITEADLHLGQIVLDVASGTGDLVLAFAKIVGKNGRVVMTDINDAMLLRGRERMVNVGIVGNVEYVIADAENLPFPKNHFDCITIAFGLRNVTEKEVALSSMYRVLKPGGKLLILEFSHPRNLLLKKGYDLYSFHIIPQLGKLVANDRESYEYLVESIRMHEDQETLKKMMLAVGFEDVEYCNLSGGIVTLHKGYKY